MDKEKIKEIILHGTSEQLKDILFNLPNPDEEEYSIFNIYIRKIGDSLLKASYHPEYEWYDFAKNNISLIAKLRQYGLD